MKKILLYITLLFLLVEGNIMAQQQMYICQAGQADAYEVNYMTQLEMMPDSFHIRQQPAYAIEEVDSIVFHHPDLPCRELGWWGNMTDGQSQYKARLRAEIEGFEPFDCDVLFIIETQAAICHSVRCELHFSEEWMAEMFFYKSTGADNPYIYVKETATGPRRFETWITNGSVLPNECHLVLGDRMLSSDCSNLLAGRPIEEVQIIIEAWVHQKPKKIDNLNNHPS